MCVGGGDLTSALALPIGFTETMKGGVFKPPFKVKEGSFFFSRCIALKGCILIDIKFDIRTLCYCKVD